MKASVTGGAGFIGRHVVARLLQDGHTVDVVDDLSNGFRENLRDFEDAPGFGGLVEGDVAEDRTWAALADRTYDLIFHLAATINVQDSIDDPARTFNADVVGTFKALEYARAKGTRFIFVSTCMVYAPAVDGTPIDERYPVRPASPYAAAKLAGEHLTISYYHAYGLSTLVLRPFNTYGPFQRTDGEGGVVVTFLANVMQGKPVVVYGDGRQTRDLLYVDDCAEFIYVAGQSTAVGSVINGGSGREIGILALARLVAEPDRITHAAHPHAQSEVWRLVCDNSKAEQLLGWRPRVGLEDGIARTRAWLERGR